jgi:hypothetical protein
LSLPLAQQDAIVHITEGQVSNSTFHFLLGVAFGGSMYRRHRALHSLYFFQLNAFTISKTGTMQVAEKNISNNHNTICGIMQMLIRKTNVDIFHFRSNSGYQGHFLIIHCCETKAKKLVLNARFEEYGTCGTSKHSASTIKCGRHPGRGIRRFLFFAFNVASLRCVAFG